MTIADQEERTLGTLETAYRLGIHPVTLQRWRSEGRGPACAKDGRSYRYKESDVERWIADHQMPEGMYHT
jgi:excisionase family DNA binding protein